MEDSLFASVLIVVALAVMIPLIMAVLGRVLGPRRPSAAKAMPYECGVDPVVDAKRRFSVKFYLVAVFFVLFDVEVAFLMPWAVNFRSGGWPMLVEMFVFLGVLSIGLFYIIKRGALEWE